MAVASQAVPMSGQRIIYTGLLLLGTAVCFMNWASVFPLIPLWIHDFRISETQAGLLSSLYSLPGFLVALPAGWLLDRYSSRWVLGGAWSIVVVGALIMVFAKSFMLLCVGRFLMSVGLWTHQVGTPKLLAVWFAGRRGFGFAMALYSWSFTAGIYLAFIYLSRVAERSGWRDALVALLALNCLTLLAICLVPANRPDIGQSLLQKGKVGISALKAPMWIAATTFLFYSAGVDAFYTYTPNYLMSIGYKLAKASLVVGSYAWIAFILKPIFGYFLNAKRAPAFIAIGGIAAIASFASLMIPSLSPYVATGLMGVSIAISLPALLGLPGFLLPAQLSGVGFGLMDLFLSLEFLTMPIIGLAIDHTRKHIWGYAIMSFYCFLSVVGILYLRSRLRPTETLATPTD